MYNFNSGPAQLSDEVIKESSYGIINYRKTQSSILELPHRGSYVRDIIEESETLVKSLMGLGNDYEVCWMQGGGRAQFALVPMNFLINGKSAGYIDSGHWSSVAIDYAKHYGNVQILGSSANSHYDHIPKWDSIPDDLAYLHITTNNTIYGTEYFHFPETPVPIVADMSSDILSRKMDYSQFDLIYATAQKNIGPTGVTLVVIKKDFLKKQNQNLPGIFSYTEVFKAHSVYNTPPVFSIFCSLLNLRWLNRMSMEIIEKRNREKATLLYSAIDESPIFSGTTQQDSRSLMNVCFRAKTAEQEEAFIDFAKQFDIKGIHGHRSVGGFRVALYNAISVEEVRHLVKTMKLFEQKIK